MKITKTTLQRIIQEELSRAIQEQVAPPAHLAASRYANIGPDRANAMDAGEIMDVVDVLMRGANLPQHRANEMMAGVDKGTAWVAEILDAISSGRLSAGHVTHAELVSMAFAKMEEDDEEGPDGTSRTAIDFYDENESKIESIIDSIDHPDKDLINILIGLLANEADAQNSNLV